MDPTVVAFVTSVASGMLANFATGAVKRFFDTAISLKPSLAQDIEAATSSQDVERIFQEAVGVIDANAGKGEIEVDSSILTALRGIRFDHAQGQVIIAGSVVQAPVLVTGGQRGATGQTLIGGNTSLKSDGTKIDVGKKASIKIKGDAQIKQT